MGKPREAYRLFVRGRKDRPHTLYHAHVDGSKQLPVGEWMTAVQRVGTNPGKKHSGTKAFRTGWHVFPTLEDLKKYCAGMNPNYVVCRVFIGGKIRPKPRSRSTVLLATEMYIPSIDWWFSSEPLGNVLGNWEKKRAA